MKRQLQTIGTRKWYGWDFLSLQEEPLKVLDSFFTQYGNFIVSGCGITYKSSGFDVAPGLVALTGKGPDNTTVKMVVPFAGLTDTPLPIYLTLGYQTVTDIYKDGKVKPVTYIYQAVASTVQPEGDYMPIFYPNRPDFDITKYPLFLDKIQDTNHRFIYDSERTRWNTAVTDVRRYSEFDYVVDSNAALAGLADNPNATCVLIKKGTWTTSSGVYLHVNTKRIVGEPGNLIEYPTSGGVCFYYKDTPDPGAGYSIEGVNVKLNKAGIGFRFMVNMKSCTCECAKVITQDESTCFHACKNLIGCSAVLHEMYHHNDGFWKCEEMQQCRISSEKSNNGDAIGIRRCNGVIQCYCDNLVEDSFNVYMCKSKSYSGSHFSSTVIATYACADTLNGGWNQRITV